MFHLILVFASSVILHIVLKTSGSSRASGFRRTCGEFSDNTRAAMPCYSCEDTYYDNSNNYKRACNGRLSVQVVIQPAHRCRGQWWGCDGRYSKTGLGILLWNFILKKDFPLFRVFSHVHILPDFSIIYQRSTVILCKFPPFCTFQPAHRCRHESYRPSTIPTHH